MNKVYLSKSKYCRAKQCNKMLWLDTNKPECGEDVAREDILKNGICVGELAKGLFGDYVDIEFHDLSKMVEKTKTELSCGTGVITEASFVYDNNFCSVDILKNTSDGLEIYEVKSSTEIKDIYLDDISYQVYILLNLGYVVKKASIVYINSEYVRCGALELDKLFKIQDVTDIVFSRQIEVKEKIEAINRYMKRVDEESGVIGMQCFNLYECSYWKYCTRNLPKPNIFDIRRMTNSKKFTIYNKGKISFKDLVSEDLNDKYKQQVMVELTGAEIIDASSIREFMKTLSYPIYFLDFETFQTPVPKYDYTRPYMQIPFQYSLHYIAHENGKLEHKEFLAEAGIDPRRKLAESLVNDIPSDVCVVAYNMQFEKMVIKELANVYIDLADKLMKIHDTMKDLMIPFSNRMYYTKAMQGSYSIKYVLPALFPNDPELDYSNLSLVHNGSEAMSIFSELETKSKEEQEKIRDALLKYCKLDTFAMVKIWEKLKEI